MSVQRGKETKLAIEEHKELQLPAEITQLCPVTGRHYGRDPLYTPSTRDCKWILTSPLGHGYFGTVFHACCIDEAVDISKSRKTAPPVNCNFVAKYVPFNDQGARILPRKFIPGPEMGKTTIQEEEPRLRVYSNKTKFDNEVNTQRNCSKSKWKICPNVLDAWQCDNGGVIIMPALKITLETLIKKLMNYNKFTDLSKFTRIAIVLAITDALYALKKFYETGYAHGDANPANFIANYNDVKGAENELDFYNRAGFDWKMIDLEKAKPLESGDVKRDWDFDLDVLRYEIINNIFYPDNTLFDASVGGENINLLDALFSTAKEFIPVMNRDEYIAGLKESTSYFKDNILSLD